MRPVLEAWVQMIAAAWAAGVSVIYTTPASRADGTDVVTLPTDLSVEPACSLYPTRSMRAAEGAAGQHHHETGC